MAGNVLVDLESGNAYRFGFETIHEPTRPIAWQRAADARALLAACLLRTSHEAYEETVQLILDASRVGSRVRFSSFLRRELTFRLAEAAISLRCVREVGGGCCATAVAPDARAHAHVRCK